MADTKLSVVLVVLALGLFATSAAQPHVCFEKLSDTAAIYLTEHPAGNKLVVATQDGLISLMSKPAVGSGQNSNDLGVFLDLTGRVLFDNEQGLLSFAFHPDFLNNGRFFVSYICSSKDHPDCQGKCAVAAIDQNANCEYNTIVAEYSAGTDPQNATAIIPTEVQKILVFGRPYANHNGGYIWFGPDGYLYYTSGDGGSGGDPLRTAQNGLVPLGKILRLDINATPNRTDWGSYSIPNDNPFVNTDGVLHEIYALGFRNPWRCSQDTELGTIICGDVGQDKMEEVDIVEKGKNYGWSFFEGILEYNPNPPADPIGGSFTAPALVYLHPPHDNGRAVIGGYVYRAQRNPCLEGKYVFGDEYGTLFLGSIPLSNSTSPNSSTAVSSEQATYTIATANGTGGGGDPFPKGDLLYSWSADSAHELYRLASSGIYRVVDSSACGFACDGNSSLLSLAPSYGPASGAAASPGIPRPAAASPGIAATPGVAAAVPGAVSPPTIYTSPPSPGLQPPGVQPPSAPQVAASPSVAPQVASVGPSQVTTAAGNAPDASGVGQNMPTGAPQKSPSNAPLPASVSQKMPTGAPQESHPNAPSPISVRPQMPLASAVPSLEPSASSLEPSTPSPTKSSPTPPGGWLTFQPPPSFSLLLPPPVKTYHAPPRRMKRPPHYAHRRPPHIYTERPPQGISAPNIFSMRPPPLPAFVEPPPTGFVNVIPPPGSNLNILPPKMGNYIPPPAQAPSSTASVTPLAGPAGMPQSSVTSTHPPPRPSPPPRKKESSRLVPSLWIHHAAFFLALFILTVFSLQK